jgi:SAM-dependent methyltransferase
MANFLKSVNKQFHSLFKVYNNTTIWGKVLIFTLLLILLIVFFKYIEPAKKEGFEQQDKFLFKSDGEIYDNFYAGIYDYLVYNQMKDEYEVGEIINKTTPSEESIILDVGSGTGHHVAELQKRDLKQVMGIDISPSMVEKAKENYPGLDFVQGDVLNADQFQPSSFTHILCLYFTIYYFKDKTVFFKNCMNWLMRGGYLIIHLVNRETFDPILPPGNPLLFVSPQKYAKKRITSTNVKFDTFSYSSNFELDQKKNIAKFVEKFKDDDTGKTRRQEHVLYMESQEDILRQAQDAGFIIQGKIDLLHCSYENQYLYILVKPQ